MKIDDDPWGHFADFKSWDWCDIADEARIQFGEIWGEEIEDASPVDDFLSAICARAHHGALQSVATALGVDVDAFESAVAPWYENQNNLPESVSPEKLMELVAESKKWYEDLKAGKFDEKAA